MMKGVFEMGPFANGTLAALAELADATKKGAVTVVGGGDSGAAAQGTLCCVCCCCCFV